MVACRELGYATGAMHAWTPPAHPATAAPPVLPPWLTGVQCVGFESSFAECDIPEYGSTGMCGATQRLFCSNDGTPPTRQSPCTRPVCRIPWSLFYVSTVTRQPYILNSRI